MNRSPEMPRVEQNLETLFDYIDEMQGFLVNRLRDFVEFRTVSSDPTKKDEFAKMADFMVGIMKKFGINSMVMNMNENEERGENGLAPLILAETEIDPGKRTVLFYCHYDVYPINYHEYWSDPFELTMTNDESELHGKGTSAGKGPLLCVINAIGAFRRNKIPLPVNVKMILDPMGTADADITGKFLRRLDTDFFFNVDFVCLCAGKWLGDTRPCVSHGCRGLCHFTVEVEGPAKDLHSGSYGGLFNEPMADLIHVLNGLVDQNGVIRVNDIYEDVCPIGKEGKQFFKSIHFSVRDLQQEMGAKELQANEDKAAILMRLWCQPSLSIHGIEGAFSEPGMKNVIPGKVTGKFSINIVPNMSPSKVKKKVVDYLAKVWKTRKSVNKVRVQMTVAKLYWHTDPANMNVISAMNAVARVYNTEPDLIREPNRVRIANVLRKITEAPVVMIPIGKSNDISDSDSEKLDVMNYINGSKILVAYMTYLAELVPQFKTPEDTECTCKITGQLESCKCYLQYIPPLPEEKKSSETSSQWSIAKILPPGMSPDEEKPAFKYYYLSLQAMKKMQKLQELIAISHLTLTGSSLSKIQQGEDEVRTSLQMKESRAALQSFSVADLHDDSKPKSGGWLPKPASTITMPQLEIPNSRVLVQPAVIAPPESSTKIITQEEESVTRPVIAALEPTVFSFRLAQNLKKGRSKPFKYEVLRKIKSVIPLTQVPDEGIETLENVNGIPSNAMPSKPLAVELQKLEAGSKSAPNLFVKSLKDKTASRSGISLSSEVSHPNVKSSITSGKALSSTSQIIFKKRLQKHVTDSSMSVKSADPSFRMVSTTKINAEPDVETKSDSTLHIQQSREKTPGGPISSTDVVSSLSDLVYIRRVNKEYDDSMLTMKSNSIPDSTTKSPTSSLGMKVTSKSVGPAADSAAKQGASSILSPEADSTARSEVSSAAENAVASSTRNPATGGIASEQPEEEAKHQRVDESNDRSQN